MDGMIDTARIRKTHEVAADDAEPDTRDGLQLLLAEISTHPLLTSAEEVALAKRIERGDVAAKHRMVESNLRLVSRSPSGTGAWASRSSI